MPGDPALTTRCPSAQPEMSGALVLGVVLPAETGNRVAYLNDTLPVNDEVLASAAPAPPTKVFRFSAICEERKCVHFDGVECNLASRIARQLPAVVDKLPPCTIRRTCRWFAQEGGAACLRCPQIVTSGSAGEPLLASIAMPGDPLATRPNCQPTSCDE
ncbi:MAG: nitrogen fixation protein [Mesorhizobium sp.]|nr:MAG: nitrogen fixation protein [Mesorhizobium sp.]